MNQPQKIEELPQEEQAYIRQAPRVTTYETPELGKLYEALAKAQGEMELAIESATNPFFKSNYADLAAIIKCSRPYLVKHGLSVIQRPMANGDGKSYLFSRLCHASGQWIESRMHLTPTKADMQGMGSAITYAKRYAYASIIGVSTGEDDDGNAACSLEKKTKKSGSLATITQMQAKSILEIVSKSAQENLMDKILGFYKISKLGDLLASSFDDCVKTLKQKEKKNEDS